jgi:hypothetical protein
MDANDNISRIGLGKSFLHYIAKNTTAQGFLGGKGAYPNLVGHVRHLLLGDVIQSGGKLDLVDGTFFLLIEGILLHDQDTESGSEIVLMGIPVDPGSILLDIYRLVRHVYRVHTDLRLLIFTDPSAVE